jgi:hypothetical protein
MTEKTNRGGEGRNTAPPSPERGSPDLPKQGSTQHGITRTERGEEQPADKSRAQQVHKSAGGSKGEKAQRDAAEQQPEWPGEPGGHE